MYGVTFTQTLLIKSKFAYCGACKASRFLLNILPQNTAKISEGLQGKTSQATLWAILQFI